jgi:hypothetical protein
MGAMERNCGMTHHHTQEELDIMNRAQPKVEAIMTESMPMTPVQSDGKIQVGMTVTDSGNRVDGKIVAVAKPRAPRSDKGKPRPIKETITVSTQMSVDDAWKCLRNSIEEGAVDDALSLTNALEAHMRSLVKAMKGPK